MSSFWYVILGFAFCAACYIVVEFLKRTGANISDLKYKKAIAEREEQGRAPFLAQQATLQKRLEVHQKAKEFVEQMLHKASRSSELADCVIAFQDWFRQNDSYMSTEVQQAIRECLTAGGFRIQLLNANDRTKQDMDDLRENWNSIERALKAINTAVDRMNIHEKTDEDG